MQRGTLCVTLLCLMALALAIRPIPFFSDDDHVTLHNRVSRIYNDIALPRHEENDAHHAPTENHNPSVEETMEPSHRDPEIYGIGSYNVEVMGIIGGSVVFPFKGIMTRFVMLPNNSVIHHRHREHDNPIDSEVKPDKPHRIRPPRKIPKGTKSYAHVNVTVQLPQPQKALILNTYTFRNKSAVDSYAVAEMPDAESKCVKEHLLPGKNKYRCHHIPEPNLKRTKCGPDGDGKLLVRECTYQTNKGRHVRMRFMYCRAQHKSLIWIRMKKIVDDKVKFYVHANVIRNLPLPVGGNFSEFRVPEICFNQTNETASNPRSNESHIEHHHHVEHPHRHHPGVHPHSVPDLHPDSESHHPHHEHREHDPHYEHYHHHRNRGHHRWDSSGDRLEHHHLHEAHEHEHHQDHEHAEHDRHHGRHHRPRHHHHTRDSHSEEWHKHHKEHAPNHHEDRHRPHHRHHHSRDHHHLEKDLTREHLETVAAMFDNDQV